MKKALKIFGCVFLVAVSLTLTQIATRIDRHAGVACDFVCAHADCSYVQSQEAIEAVEAVEAKDAVLCEGDCIVTPAVEEELCDGACVVTSAVDCDCDECLIGEPCECDHAECSYVDEELCDGTCVVEVGVPAEYCEGGCVLAEAIEAVEAVEGREAIEGVECDAVCDHLTCTYQPSSVDVEAGKFEDLITIEGAFLKDVFSNPSVWLGTIIFWKYVLVAFALLLLFVCGILELHKRLIRRGGSEKPKKVVIRERTAPKTEVETKMSKPSRFKRVDPKDKK